MIMRLNEPPRTGGILSVKPSLTVLIGFTLSIFLASHQASAQQNGPDLVVDQAYLESTIFIENIGFDSEHCALKEGCVNGTGLRKLLRFGTLIGNIGNAAFVIGTPDPNNSIWHFDSCPSHYHWHYSEYADYQLFDLSGRELNVGHKQGFCVRDTEQYQSNNPCNTFDDACDLEQAVHGISSGCGDNYPESLDCQWLDITGVTDGLYALRVTTNPKRLLPETNFDNNSAFVVFRLQGNTVVPFVTNVVGDPKIHPGDPADVQPITDGLYDIAGCFGQSSISDNELDEGGSNRPIALSHIFDTAYDGRQILSAFLGFRFKGNSDGVNNDFFVFQNACEGPITTDPPCKSPSRPIIVVTMKDLLRGNEPEDGEAHTVVVDLSKVPVRILSSCSQIPQGRDSWRGGPDEIRDLRPAPVTDRTKGLLDLLFLDCDLTLDFSVLSVEFGPALPKPANENEETIARLPSNFALIQNHPNPFNPETMIQFALPQPGEVTLRIYDLLGHEVKTLVAGRKEAGSHDVLWDGKDALGREVASGVYLYRLEVQADSGERFTAIRKMSLMR